MLRLVPVVFVATLAACSQDAGSTARRAPEAVVEAYLNAWDQGDLSAVDILFAQGALHEDMAQGVRAIGHDQIKDFMARSRELMPDFNRRITSIFTDGANIAAEWSLTAFTAPGSSGPAS